MKEFNAVDYNAEMTFDAVKILSLFRTFYEELGRKFIPWVDDVLNQSWQELTSEHDEVGNSYQW
jgi:proteasome activator subunit 4